LKILSKVNPTPEQLLVIESDTFRTCLIRGAAGSGKTTSAVLRCRKVIAGIAADRHLKNDDSPIQALVLTFSRTLTGYIEELVEREAKAIGHEITLTVDTFAGWAFSQIGAQRVVADSDRRDLITTLWENASEGSRLTPAFVVDEVDYVLGRFGRSGLNGYLDAAREGRGRPSIPRGVRQTLIDSVMLPYLDAVDARGLIDWNDCAEAVLELDTPSLYDVVILDEVQDFSVQAVRALLSRVKERSSVTFVIDSAQAIYPRGIDWNDVGLDPATTDTHRLRNNYRNTPQIAQFAQPLLTGMRLSDDGTLPDYRNCRDDPGRTPTLIVGRFREQVDYVIKLILAEVDLDSETVGILTPWGDPRRFVGGRLDANLIPWCQLKRQKTWPSGPENVGISTLHSAKGLEFDHVFILGFDVEFLPPHGTGAEDGQYLQLRRLFAMAITRAKRTVVIGFRESHRPEILDLLDPNTYLLERLRDRT